MPDDKTTIAQLKSVPMFADLSNRDLRAMARTVKQISQPKGKEVIAEGESGAGFHLILEGSATVSQHGVVRRTLGPGDYFGEIALIDGKPRSAQVVAGNGLETLSLTAWEFRPLLDESPELTRSLLLTLCERLRQAEEQQQS